MVLHTFSLFDRTYLCFFSLFFFFSFLFFLASLPPFIGTSLAFFSLIVLLLAKLLEIFFFTLSVSSPPLSWSSDFWGVFVLFRLSYMHSMWQGLGGNPLINAEVKIFNLLVSSRSFLWFQAFSGSHTWIIHALCLG